MRSIGEGTRALREQNHAYEGDGKKDNANDDGGVVEEFFRAALGGEYCAIAAESGPKTGAALLQKYRECQNDGENDL